MSMIFILKNVCFKDILRVYSLDLHPAPFFKGRGRNRFRKWGLDKKEVEKNRGEDECLSKKLWFHLGEIKQFI